MKPALSVVVATHNEEKTIASCLKSLLWVQEVIVVDGLSSDRTAEISRDLGAKVFEVENQPLMKKNMNMGFSRAKNKWILSVDADERVNSFLRREVEDVIQRESDTVAYKIPRKNLIFGKWIEHTGWYPDYQFRLFKKGKAKFPGKNVHEELLVDGQIGELKNPLEHYHINSVSEFISPHRLDNYTTVEAQNLISSGKKVTWVDAVRFPFEEFLRRFFAWEGYKDGLHGLVLSLLMAFYWEVVFAKIWEKQGFPKYGDELFLDELSSAAKKMGYELRHWQMVSTKNFIKRSTYRLRNKLPF